MPRKPLLLIAAMISTICSFSGTLSLMIADGGALAASPALFATLPPV